MNDIQIDSYKKNSILPTYIPFEIHIEYKLKYTYLQNDIQSVAYKRAQ